MVVIDVMQGWSKVQVSVSLSQMTNCKMFKLTDELFVLAAVKFMLYQILLQPKIKLKLVEEILAWDYSTHQKMLVTSHKLK
jgi:hypothetical protein